MTRTVFWTTRRICQEVFAEQEDVAGDALDGEVFVDGAHEGFVRFGDDAEVAEFGNGAAVLQGRQAGGAAGRGRRY